MAHLLGSKNCLESLSKDVADLEETIQSVLLKISSRVEFVSWKFPSKNAVKLNIAEILDDYSYCNDEESNRLSHIIMFELVIDRLCLLLQVVSKLFGNIMDISGEDEKRPKSQTVTATMSIGLVCKKFWNKMSQLQYRYQNQSKELSDYNQTLMEMEKITTELKLENHTLQGKHGKVYQNVPKLAINFNNSSPERNSAKDQEDHTSISTQTFETAFVDCATCEDVQTHLLDVGNCIVRICESESLPSGLNKQNKVIRSTKLSCSNINKWSKESQKDLQKVQSVVSEYSKRSNELKIENESLKEQNNDLENSIQQHKEERERLLIVEKCLSEHSEKLKTSLFEKDGQINECKTLLKKQKQDQKEAEDKVISVQSSLCNSKDEIEKYKASVRALEQGMNSLSEQMKSTENSQQKIQELEKTIKTTTERLQQCENYLETVTEEATKLKSERKMLLKHDQSLQTKQSSLVSRLEEMDERCEDLQTQMSDLVEEKEEIEESNKDIRRKLTAQEDEIESLKKKLKHQKDYEVLENNVNNEQCMDEIENLKRQLELVVSYPVMGDGYKVVENEYLETLNERHFHDNSHSNDNDVALDMERQLKANTARIATLEKQNASLRNTIMKIDEKAKHDIYDHSEDERSLKKINRIAKSAPQRMINDQKPHHEPRPPSSTRPQMVRLRSGGHRAADDIQARLADLEKLKNNVIEGGHKKNSWTVESRDENKERIGNTSTAFFCPDCQKEHISKRDLEIHRPFCFARL